MTDSPATQPRNSVLIGKIVNWPHRGEPEDGPYLGAGRGKVVALLDGPFLLVRRLPRGDDPEPSSMLIISMTETGLLFFDTNEDEEAWYKWICNDPQPLVRLVKR
jgi:hypothetical protein